jgi:hypothetical protein
MLATVNSVNSLCKCRVCSLTSRVTTTRTRPAATIAPRTKTLEVSQIGEL